MSTRKFTRANRGSKINQLISEDAFNKNEFWGSDAMKQFFEEEDDDDAFVSEEEEDDFDSDFFEFQQSEEDEESIEQGEEQSEKSQNSKRHFEYIDPKKQKSKIGNSKHKRNEDNLEVCTLALKSDSAFCESKVSEKEISNTPEKKRNRKKFTQRRYIATRQSTKIESSDNKQDLSDKNATISTHRPKKERKIFEKLSQSEMLEEAKITEKKNTTSLIEQLKLEDEKKKAKKVKQSILSKHIRFLSTEFEIDQSVDPPTSIDTKSAKFDSQALLSTTTNTSASAATRSDSPSHLGISSIIHYPGTLADHVPGSQPSNHILQSDILFRLSNPIAISSLQNKSSFLPSPFHRQTKTGPILCLITGQPAQFIDPITRLPSSSVSAFAALRRMPSDSIGLLMAISMGKKTEWEAWQKKTRKSMQPKGDNKLNESSRKSKKEKEEQKGTPRKRACKNAVSSKDEREAPFNEENAHKVTNDESGSRSCRDQNASKNDIFEEENRNALQMPPFVCFINDAIRKLDLLRKPKSSSLQEFSESVRQTSLRHNPESKLIPQFFSNVVIYTQ
eukprot:MONOS_8079.1-p1 / transcript=MONOS_8079.1 / gene=MONOS_8079 / organism=Monocercomonoides_exilis_PA203 / gene_product=unspecified product / transcript_product=unspecified product / location=Mono_scaffold00295:13125-15195(+) / protein_length=560 / sequence_SO=supercontig / SO=protein_coding / is_pseudo=false